MADKPDNELLIMNILEARASRFVAKRVCEPHLPSARVPRKSTTRSTSSSSSQISRSPTKMVRSTQVVRNSKMDRASKTARPLRNKDTKPLNAYMNFVAQ